MSETINIIPIGDHCAIAMALEVIDVRRCSYPFDWITTKEPLHDTNIMYNIDILNELFSTEDIEYIVEKFIGNACENNHLNSGNNMLFPHDTEAKTDVFEKYKRRFLRLKTELNKKNIFILLTRHYYIEEEIFQTIIKDLLKYNNESLILFISGTDHTYFSNPIYNTKCIFKYIPYDISKFYNYDYTDFRPNLEKFLKEFLSAYKLG